MGTMRNPGHVRLHSAAFIPPVQHGGSKREKEKKKWSAFIASAKRTAAFDATLRAVLIAQFAS